MRRATLLLVAVAMAWLACEVGPRSGQGLRLPDGDVEAGRLAFQELACTTCHDVARVSMEAAGERGEDPRGGPDDVTEEQGVRRSHQEQDDPEPSGPSVSNGRSHRPSVAGKARAAMAFMRAGRPAPCAGAARLRCGAPTPGM